MKANHQEKIKQMQKIFDVHRYDEVRNWSPHDWLCALSKRYGLAMSLGLPLPDGHPAKTRKPFIYAKEKQQEKVDYLLTNPTDLTNAIPMTFSIDELRDLTIPDILHLADRIIEFTDEIASANKSDVNGENASARDVLPLLRLRDIRNGVKIRTTQYIAVDLSATDETIRSKFEVWLQKSRSEIGINSNLIDVKLNRNDMTKWYSQKLLPYIDLKMWMEVHNEELSQEVIGNLIFSGNDFAGKLRSTKKNAFTLFHKETMASLSRECHGLSKLSAQQTTAS